MASTSEILRALNNIPTGRLDRVLESLDRARRQLEESGHAELAEKLLEARQALLSANESLYQKRLAYVTSKLGHLK
jgi:vacuolar-type H+-ATPase subunit E/Vma4